MVDGSECNNFKNSFFVTMSYIWQMKREEHSAVGGKHEQTISKR